MKTIAFANLKGGVGKSTLAVHTAWYFAERNLRTLLIDLDPQGNSSSTLRDYAIDLKASQLFEETKIPVVGALPSCLASVPVDRKLGEVAKEGFGVLAHFVDNVGQLSKYFDVCVIDTSPAFDRRTEAALLAADYFATPVDVETYALEGLGVFMDKAREILTFKTKNSQKLEFLGVIANKVVNNSPMHKRNLKDLATTHAKIVVPHPISSRTNIGEAIAERVPVWRMPKTAARDAGREMRVLLDFLAARMGFPKEAA